jgi:hypothetical protein
MSWGRNRLGILWINSGSNGRSPGPGADIVCNGGGPRLDLGEAIVVRGPCRVWAGAVGGALQKAPSPWGRSGRCPAMPGELITWSFLRRQKTFFV